VRDQALRMASRVLEVAEDDLSVRGGRIEVSGVPGQGISLGELAKASKPASGYLRADEPAGLSSRHRFETEHMTYPYGAHIAAVETDKHTGEVRVLRYLVGYEVGHAIDETMVAGQLRG